jgi:hypothetical protein
MTIERPNIMYYFQGSSLDDASDFADRHEQAYQTINETFKAELPRKLRLFVWADRALGEQLLNYPLGFTVPDQCVCYIRNNQTLGHEMTHVLSHWGWGIQPTAKTKFINEGVAVAFDLNSNNKIETAKAAVSGKGIPSVADVWSGSFPASDDIIYPLGGAFMHYLNSQNLPDQFKALIKNQTIESAENLYGKDKLNSLIADFDQLVEL